MDQPTGPGQGPAEHRPAHAVPPTTHTIDQRQVAEINARLADGAVVTAGAVGLADAPADARIAEVVLEGSPEFPYVYAQFSDSARVPLHTEALRKISHALHLQGHHWGL